MPTVQHTKAKHATLRDQESDVNTQKQITCHCSTWAKIGGKEEPHTQTSGTTVKHTEAPRILVHGTIPESHTQAA